MMKLRPLRVIKALDNAVADAFETMAYSEIVGKQSMSALPGWTKTAVGSMIDINSPLQAKISLIIHTDHARTLLKAVSGDEDEPVDDTMVNDIIKEITNEIAGGFAGALIARGEEVSIGLPVIVDNIRDEWTRTAQNQVHSFVYTAEDREVICCLELD